MKRTLAVTLLAVLAAAASVRALEISLEENRGERGSVGYVDLQAVFRRFPETQRAKQSYAEIVRQAEEQVNLRKAALIALRGDISRLKAERDMTAKTPIVVIPPPLPAPAPVLVSTAAAPPTAPASGMEGLPGMSRPSPTPAASMEPIKINIPGLPEETLPAPKTAALPPSPAPTLAQIIAAVPDQVQASTSAGGVPAADPTAQAEEQLRRRDAKVKEIEERIAAKEHELAAKEAALKDYEAQVEKNLVDIESKRSEALLGRIYQVVRETARESGVSVVIDKGSILFGQESVDLTDRVLKKLEASLP